MKNQILVVALAILTLSCFASTFANANGTNGMERPVIVTGWTADGFMEFHPHGDPRAYGIEEGYSYFAIVGLGVYKTPEEVLRLSNYFSKNLGRQPCNIKMLYAINKEHGVHLNHEPRRGSRIYLCLNH